MTYRQTLDFLFSKLPAYYRIGKAAFKDDLNNSLALDEYFGHPHSKYLTIHVAGTNGKGSVAHMLASILQEAGYRTGLYTSPHLKDFRERIRINGAVISEAAVIDFVKNHRVIIESLQPSFFEMTVAMAFNYFEISKVDVAVIEVGLGGRLDSTNIILPVLSVITNIGSDHMDLLGDTFEKIAKEKAGIIKRGIPVVISETHSDTKDVFSLKAEECSAQIDFADRIFSCNLEEEVSYEGWRRYMVNNLMTGKSYDGMTSLPGDCQVKNLKGVFAAVSSLRNILRISDKDVSTGIRQVVSNTGIKGRWQVLSSNPLIICDTAHNKEGLEQTLAQVKRIPKTRLHIIAGFVNDKNLGSILPLFPKEAIYYFTRASIPRALHEQILKSEASKYNLTGESYPDVISALISARRNASASDIIFVGGSTFVVAEVV